PFVGEDAAGGAGLHGPSAVDGHLSGDCDCADRPRLQYAGRRSARPPRPATTLGRDPCGGAQLKSLVAYAGSRSTVSQGRWRTRYASDGFDETGKPSQSKMTR